MIRRSETATLPPESILPLNFFSVLLARNIPLCCVASSARWAGIDRLASSWVSELRTVNCRRGADLRLLGEDKGIGWLGDGLCDPDVSSSEGSGVCGSGDCLVSAGLRAETMAQLPRSFFGFDGSDVVDEGVLRVLCLGVRELAAGLRDIVLPEGRRSVSLWVFRRL